MTDKIKNSRSLMTTVELTQFIYYFWVEVRILVTLHSMPMKLLATSTYNNNYNLHKGKRYVMKNYEQFRYVIKIMNRLMDNFVINERMSILFTNIITFK